MPQTRNCMLERLKARRLIKHVHKLESGIEPQSILGSAIQSNRQTTA